MASPKEIAEGLFKANGIDKPTDGMMKQLQEKMSKQPFVNNGEVQSIIVDHAKKNFKKEQEK